MKKSAILRNNPKKDSGNKSLKIQSFKQLKINQIEKESKSTRIKSKPETKNKKLTPDKLQNSMESSKKLSHLQYTANNY